MKRKSKIKFILFLSYTFQEKKVIHTFLSHILLERKREREKESATIERLIFQLFN